MSQPKLDPSQILTGTALGIATLDGSGKLDASQIPSGISGGLVFKGTWDANTNTPTLYSGNTHGEAAGWEYVVSVAGNTNIDGGNPWLVGDALIHNGTVWTKVPSTASVTSITGTSSQIVASSATGAVTLSLANPINVDTSGNAATATTASSATTAGTAAGLSVTLVATSGGTGHNTYVVGDLLVGGATNTLDKVVDVALGSVLISGGVGAAPTWSNTPTISHLIVEGVTSTGATGTGKFVFDASPTLTTPALNGIPTGTGVASASTASTLVLRDASSNFSAGVVTTQGVATAIRTMSSSGSVSLTDSTILASGTFTITLLNPTTVPVGRTFVIKDIGFGVITILPFGAETIDGNTGVVVNRRWDSITIQTDGTNWYIL